MVEGGIKGIWNFIVKEIEVKGDVVVENVYLIDSLMVLLYKLNEKFFEKERIK